MAKGISVKVSTVKVIKALEAKLASGAAATINNEKKRKDFEKLQKAWAKETAEIAFKQISKGDVSASENYRGEVSVRIELPAGTIKLPAEPQFDREQELGNWEVTEIENAIRILKMTDEEFVNASTFNKVAQYL